MSSDLWSEPAHEKKVLITLANSDCSDKSLRCSLTQHRELEETFDRAGDLTPTNGCACAFEGYLTEQRESPFSHETTHLFIIKAKKKKK